MRDGEEAAVTASDVTVPSDRKEHWRARTPEIDAALERNEADDLRRRGYIVATPEEISRALNRQRQNGDLISPDDVRAAFDGVSR